MYQKISGKYLITVLQLALIAFISVSIAQAAGAVDPTFNPALVKVRNSSSIDENFVNRIAVQPDGKILIGGYFQAAGKFVRTGIVRLNADGTVDTGFNPPVIIGSDGVNPRIGGTIDAIVVQADGKILIGGGFNTVGGQARSGIARLNADGSLDTSFNISGFDGGVFDIKVSADNKITIGGTVSINGTRLNIIRVLADGTLDTSFNAPPEIANSSGLVFRVELLADGKTLVGGGIFPGGASLPIGFVYRLNTNGSADATFSTVTTYGPNSGYNPVRALALQPDGKFLAGGGFTQINGFPVNGLARFNADGTIDSSFDINGTHADGLIFDIEILPNGKIIIGGNFTTYNGSERINVAMLESNGSVSTALNYTNINRGVLDVAVLPDGKILVGANVPQDFLLPALVRLNTDGSTDNNFNVVLGNFGTANKELVQPDGKILIGGAFTHVDNQIRYSLSRVNPDGTLDTTFNPPNLNTAIYGIDLRADGKILISTGSGTYRLNANGSIDIVSSPGSTSYDGKFLPGGGAIITQSTVRLRKIYESGSIDTSLDLTADAAIRKILIQPDGKFVVVGDFTQIGGVARGRIARINADGTLDTTFNPAGGANGSIYDAVLLSNGKIIVGGGFSGINFNNNYKFLARLNSDGSLDASFNPILQGGVQSLKIQPDGKILVGGSMYTINGFPIGRIARLNQDGSLDSSFNAGAGADDAVLSIDLQADGSVIIGGLFTHVNNVDRLGVARLLSPTTTTRTPFDFDGDGKSDLSVFRPSTGIWYISQSSTNTVATQPFGASGDLIAPADFDGDGKFDLAVFRPSTGIWYLQRSTAGFAQIQFGANGDLPMPGDYDGDGKAELAVFRPSTGVWYEYNLVTNQAASIAFGINGDIPVAGDYDQDGKVDIAVFRPSSGIWYLNRSTAGFTAVQFGQAGDLVVPADYDADGKTDIAVFRPSNGTWYLNRSTAGFTAIQFGQAGDKPAPADYDGDGRIDLAVFRPSNGVWYLNRSTSGFTGIQFGISEDLPAPNAFVR